MAALRAAPALMAAAQTRRCPSLFCKTEVFHMRVLVLGGSTAGVQAAERAAQAGHQVTLCTPYYALGEDAAGSWAVHSKTG